jgi:hypothetical protein
MSADQSRPAGDMYLRYVSPAEVGTMNLLNLTNGNSAGDGV